MPYLRRAILSAAVLSLPLLAAACSFIPTAGRGDLPTTLSFQEEPGGPVAFQDGQPVPTFDWEPRLRAELDGAWKFDPEPLDTNLSLANRDSAMPGIKAEMGSRADTAYDDASWSQVTVPGSFNPPPNKSVTGGYFRRDFELPDQWTGQYAMLKFDAVRYVADVWLNGKYLGHHEGGDTPFALDASSALIADAVNTLLVRVDNPPWGTRDDIVPWGLADWWNYGGIVGDVWLEATPALSAVRADVIPHLDGADLTVVVQHRGSATVDASLDVRLWPAQVNPSNLLNPDAYSLVPPDAQPLLDHDIDLGSVGGESVFRVPFSFVMRSADLWSPSRPALYVLGVTVSSDGIPGDQLYTSFGLRQVKVDSSAPRILLNGDPIAFNGVALHEERQTPVKSGDPAGGPLTSIGDISAMLERALKVHADLVRVDHHPPAQVLPMLADRLGLAVWEEIPLYHYTPQTFTIAMDRGLPQQMLAEMDLRDMNRPSVLFHGFANESTGTAERQNALGSLRALDRRIDGTRLTGQAAYGTDPSDPTSAGLDVAGYTLYSGVLYGGRLSGVAVQSALQQAHKTYPHKPILILEYGRWADTRSDEAEQVRVFNTYYSQISRDFDTAPGGFVAASAWWTLDDYWTQRPGIEVENFGVYRPGGSLRPVGNTMTEAYAATEAAAPVTTPVRSQGVAVALQPTERHSHLGLYIAYALALPALLLMVAIAVLGGRRRPAW